MPVPNAPATCCSFQNIAVPLGSRPTAGRWKRERARALRDVPRLQTTTHGQLGAAKYRLRAALVACGLAIPLWMLLLVVITLRGAW
jgi:hypothetical protein